MQEIALQKPVAGWIQSKCEKMEEILKEQKKIEEEATNKIEEEINSADDCVKSKGD